MIKEGRSDPHLPNLGGLKAGIFVGSFNPFTIGHDSIVRRALPLFDRLIIGVVGDQVHKPDMPSAEERVKAIRELYASEPRIEVKPYYGLAVDFAKLENARFIVKGVRSVKDFEYERDRFGRPYGWGTARYAIPERLYGNAFAMALEGSDPEQARSRAAGRLRRIVGKGFDNEIQRLIG